MTIYEKLTKIQTELKAPKGQYNSFGKYSYRSAEDILEGVKPLLLANGLTQLITDDIQIVGDRYYIKATVTLYDNEGQSISVSAFAREELTKKGMDASQITGSASSYARKYALNGMYAIDDTKDADHDSYPTTSYSKQPLKKETGISPKLQEVFDMVNNNDVDFNKVTVFIKKGFGKTKSTDLNEKEIEELHKFVSDLVKAGR